MFDEHSKGDGASRDLLIRWTFGDWPRHQTDPQALSLLRISIRFAKVVFPGARLVLCYNRLSASRDEVMALGHELAIPLFDSRPHLPKHLRRRVRNSWWKYAPPRLNPNGFELILDNDVVLWRRPPAIDEWLVNGGLLALGTRQADVRPKLYYGDYCKKVREVDPLLDLNAGILGWPPSYLPPIPPASGLGEASEFFHTEQGFSAFAFATFTGVKHLIPYAQVPLLHIMRVDPQRLVDECSGGHFCECTYGHNTFWADTYQEVVTAHLRAMHVTSNA